MLQSNHVRRQRLKDLQGLHNLTQNPDVLLSKDGRALAGVCGNVASLKKKLSVCSAADSSSEQQEVCFHIFMCVQSPTKPQGLYTCFSELCPSDFRVILEFCKCTRSLFNLLSVIRSQPILAVQGLLSILMH